MLLEFALTAFLLQLDTLSDHIIGTSKITIWSSWNINSFHKKGANTEASNTVAVKNVDAFFRCAEKFLEYEKIALLLIA